MINDAEEILTVAGLRLVTVGVEWDTVKVERHLGVRAIELLEEPGAVAVDPCRPEPMLYFLVPAGSAAHWDVPETAALGSNSYVVLPPDHRDAPPGPYWLIPQQHGLTAAAALRQALEAAK
ncbi:hypothetical protein [Streptomyces cylindrosporus]|uniref:Uncharacterized protein n=1 Tax=Streptomyces cylindrosporus TaxID=2927583 RepID=A0ABS9YI86_9ACTN|nr:hypothetical protein [Streptomyces cylindrosporus]MCI3276962.1 hypothetical protein [Streptomyces cylindrosporus]